MQAFIRSFFTFSGRLNRKAYLARLIAIKASLLIPFLIFVNFMPDIVEFGGGGLLRFGLNALTVLAAICLLAVLLLDIRRLHDMDISGKVIFMVILLFIIGSLIADIVSQVLYLLWTVLLIFRKGTDGANRYGEDPLADKAANASGI